MVRQLTLLQIDPVAAIAPNADLVTWSRLGPSYAPAERTGEIFGFDYQLEMYKPAAKRRWGYFALPILSGDALVGKLGATADRSAGVLRVNAVHQDVPFTAAMTAAVNDEIGDLARWLGLALQPPGRS
jgi:uncharacterized protein